MGGIMAKAKVKLYYTSSQYLDSLPVNNGNIIFVPDSNVFCLDMSNQRFTYSTIRTFETETQRAALAYPNEGYYFVEETQVFWRWNGAWVQITPSNLEPVVYGVDINALPSVGKPNTLYYTDDGIYHWKDGEYKMIGNINTWDSIE